MNKELRKKIYFITGGGIGYIINLVITIYLTEIVSINYMVSYSIGLGTSILFNFIFAIKVIFNVKNRYLLRFLGYLIFIVLFFITNLVAVNLFTESAGMNYIISILFTTLVMWSIKYVIYNNLIFRS